MELGLRLGSGLGLGLGLGLPLHLPYISPVSPLYVAHRADGLVEVALDECGHASELLLRDALAHGGWCRVRGLGLGSRLGIRVTG